LLSAGRPATQWEELLHYLYVVQVELFPQSLMTPAKQFVTALEKTAAVRIDFVRHALSLLLAPANTKLVACNLHPI
jgi:hypothetical protein